MSDTRTTGVCCRELRGLQIIVRLFRNSTLPQSLKYLEGEPISVCSC